MENILHFLLLYFFNVCNTVWMFSVVGNIERWHLTLYNSRQPWTRQRTDLRILSSINCIYSGASYSVSAWEIQGVVWERVNWLKCAYFKSFAWHYKSTTRWWSCCLNDSGVGAYQRYGHLIGQKVGEACSSADQSLLAEQPGWRILLTHWSCRLLSQQGQRTAS